MHLMFPGDCVHEGNGSEDFLGMEGSSQGVNIILCNCPYIFATAALTVSGFQIPEHL